MAETGKATSQEFQIQSIVLENINGSPLVIYPTPKDDDVTMDVFHGMHISESIFDALYNIQKDKNICDKKKVIITGSIGLVGNFLAKIK